MKYGFLTKIMVLPVVLLLGLGGCVSETREDTPPVTPGKQTELTFKVQVPDQSIPGQTRATAADEVISSIDLLLFDNNGDYEDHKTVVVGTMTDNKLTFSIKLDAGTYNVVTIANFATEIATLKTTPGFTGLNKAGVLALLETSETNPWNISTTKIPMYGETGTIAVTPGMSAVSMNLTRMLARIDVKVTAPQADFELENILLCNYHMTGYVAPKWNTSTGAIITPAHTDTNIPTSATAVTGASGALVYTPGSQTYEGQIYTFEADKAVDGTSGDAGRIDAPCLLIKGKYKGGKSYWYRVDFTKAPTPTEMADPDWDPSQVEYLPLLRNYRYVVDITEASGIGYEYSTDALAAYSVMSNLKVRLMCYDEGEVGDIVFNGQYYLGIGEAETELSAGTAGGAVLALTNYPGGWTIDTNYGSGTGVTYEGLENGWLTPSQGTATTANGIVKADVVLTPTANTSGADRVAYVHLRAGRLTHKVKVIQKSIWIRIYATDESTILTEMAFNSKNSLIGIAPTQQHFIVKWDPAELEPTITKTTASGANAFTWTNSTYNWLSLPAGGFCNLGINPPAITQANVDSDPFYEKETIVTYKIDAGGGAIAMASIKLSQTHYQLLAENFLSAHVSQVTRTGKVKSNADWQVSASNTDGVLVSFAPESGTANKAGTDLNYTLDGSLGKVVFTFSHESGLFDDVTVTVHSGSIAPFFARSNIVLNSNGTLGFAVTEQDNVAIPANVQGLHFKFGSLIGVNVVASTISPVPYNASHIVFTPSDYTGVMAAVWDDVPYADGAGVYFTDSGVYGNTSKDEFAGYNTVGYDDEMGVGDICRYISDQNWVNGRWRIPTAEEYVMLQTEGTKVNGYVHPGYSDSSLITSADGMSPRKNGYWVGVDRASNVDMASPTGACVYFPIGGRRTTAGALEYIHQWGYYATNSMYSSLLNYNTLLDVGGFYGGWYADESSQSRKQGWSVRCIRETY